MDLAKSLEGKVATESICMEIINQLRGQIHERTIRAFLDEKYKQKTRMENARKQQKQPHKANSNDNLAVLMPLEKEAEDQKEVMMVEVDGGQISIQGDDDEQDNEVADDDEQPTISKDFSLIKDEDYVAETTFPSEQQKLSPKPLEENAGSQSVNSPVNQHFESIGPEDTTIEEPSQTVAADNTVPNVLPKQNSECSLSNVDGSNIKHAEFSMKYRLLAEHMRPLYKQNGNNVDIWFNFKYDKNTGKVISSKLGRINEG